MKRVSATDAKNSFGGLLEDVMALGCVEIVRHGRPVAVVVSPQEWRSAVAGQAPATPRDAAGWRRNHIVPAELARTARRVGPPIDLDDA